jgi:hypothetical protein
MADISKLNTPAELEKLARQIDWIRRSNERVERMTKDVERISARFATPFPKVYLQDRLNILLDAESVPLRNLESDSWRTDHILVSTELPKRGWYLSGAESCRLTFQLADLIRSSDWDRIDQAILDNLPKYKLDKLPEFLSGLGLPDFCVTRFTLFVSHHEQRRFEEATFLGVPLIDEVAFYLFEGKAFTTKRGGRLDRPQIAISSAKGPSLSRYSNSFVKTFGCLQLDVETHRLNDENYWNRSAIVHGLMQRQMGVKDSAKCLMALTFLLSARDKNSES